MSRRKRWTFQRFGATLPLVFRRGLPPEHFHLVETLQIFRNLISFYSLLIDYYFFEDEWRLLITCLGLPLGAMSFWRVSKYSSGVFVAPTFASGCTGSETPTKSLKNVRSKWRPVCWGLQHDSDMPDWRRIIDQSDRPESCPALSNYTHPNKTIFWYNKWRKLCLIKKNEM